MVVGDAGPEPEPDVGADSVNVGELSTVVSVGVKQFDEFDFVFLCRVRVHDR